LLWSDVPLTTEEQLHSPDKLGFECLPVFFVFSCEHFHFENLLSRGFAQKGEANAVSVSIKPVCFPLFKNTLIKKKEKFK